MHNIADKSSDTEVQSADWGVAGFSGENPLAEESLEREEALAERSDSSELSSLESSCSSSSSVYIGDRKLHDFSTSNFTKFILKRTWFDVDIGPAGSAVIL